MGVMASLLPMDLAAFKVPAWLVGWLVECSELGQNVVFMFGLGREWCVDGLWIAVFVFVVFFFGMKDVM